MSDQNTKETQAKLLVFDLQISPQLQDSWNKQIQSCKGKGTDCLNSWIKSHDYETDITTVEQIITKPKNATELPNSVSNQVAFNLLWDTELRQAFTDRANQALDIGIAGGASALQPMIDFLAEKKIEAHPIQIAQSILVTILNTQANYIGCYGKTILFQKKIQKSGPTILISNDFVSVGIDLIINSQWDNKTRTLTWSTEDLNISSGTLTFTQRDHATPEDPYVGPEFSGKITLPEKNPYGIEGEAIISGRWGNPGKDLPPSVISK